MGSIISGLDRKVLEDRVCNWTSYGAISMSSKREFCVRELGDQERRREVEFLRRRDRD